MCINKCKIDCICHAFGTSSIKHVIFCGDSDTYTFKHMIFWYEIDTANVKLTSISKATVFMLFLAAEFQKHRFSHWFWHLEFQKNMCLWQFVCAQFQTHHFLLCFWHLEFQRQSVKNHQKILVEPTKNHTKPEWYHWFAVKFHVPADRKVTKYIL